MNIKDTQIYKDYVDMKKEMGKLEKQWTDKKINNMEYDKKYKDLRDNFYNNFHKYSEKEQRIPIIELIRTYKKDK